jgi:hypothetical protein
MAVLLCRPNDDMDESVTSQTYSQLFRSLECSFSIQNMLLLCMLLPPAGIPFLEVAAHLERRTGPSQTELTAWHW